MNLRDLAHLVIQRFVILSEAKDLIFPRSEAESVAQGATPHRPPNDRRFDRSHRGLCNGAAEKSAFAAKRSGAIAQSATPKPPAPFSRALFARKGGVPAIAATLLIAALTLTACNPPRSSRLTIACKNFTEQVILGELLAQQVEAEGEPVDRRFYLAGSYIAHQALVSGRIDAYVEYSGTALSAVLKQPLDKNPQSALETIRRIYEQKYRITVAPSLGFEDTFSMIVRGDDPRFSNITTLSQLAPLAPQLALGVGYEFQSRPDGLPAVQQTYGLHFGPQRVMDLGLLYRSLGARQVDIVSGNSTDGTIPVMHLRVLQDDRHAFPPYEAVPLVRDDALAKHPALQRALQRLAGKVTAEEMQAMNHAVDGDHRDPADVVRNFRRTHDL